MVRSGLAGRMTWIWSGALPSGTSSENRQEQWASETREMRVDLTSSQRSQGAKKVESSSLRAKSPST